MIRATSMRLRHLGYTNKSDALDNTLNTVLNNSSYAITSHEDGITAGEFTAEII